MITMTADGTELNKKNKGEQSDETHKKTENKN